MVIVINVVIHFFILIMKISNVVISRQNAGCHVMYCVILENTSYLPCNMSNGFSCVLFHWNYRAIRDNEISLNMNSVFVIEQFICQVFTTFSQQKLLV